MEAEKGGSTISTNAQPRVATIDAKSSIQHEYTWVPNDDSYSQAAEGNVDSQVPESMGVDRGQSAISNQKHSARQFREGVVIWWEEVLACFVSVAAIVATFATFYHYQNTPSTAWPQSISINALLSVYLLLLRVGVAAILATGLARQKWNWFGSERPLYDIALFDEATRGAYGSLILLQRIHVQHFLTSLGCLLGVVAVFVDPFAQQILQYDECNVPAKHGFAPVPRTNFFQGHGLNMGYSEALSSPVQDAISVGITAPGQSVDVQCSTGNCTFPIFDTLEFCSSSEDISDRVHFRYGNTSQQSSTPRKNSSFLHPWRLLQCQSHFCSRFRQLILHVLRTNVQQLF